MPEPTILALSGKKGGGKNTLASFISSYYQRNIAGRGSKFEELSFADDIKSFCIDVLGLRRSQCYGSDEEKNTLTPYKWENTPMGANVGNYLTAREVMQIFGTECVRNWFGNVWAESTIRKIRRKALDFAIITDNRFPNETETVLGQSQGYIIRLTRSPHSGDTHVSETALDDFDWERPNCFVLDNAHMSIDEQNAAAETILRTIFQQGAGT